MYTCSMPASRFIHLIDDDAKQLRAIEQNAHLKPKVRLRAQVLRRSHRGDTVAQIAASTGRRATSICRDLDRWQDHGVAGLADGMAPGQSPRRSRAFSRSSWPRRAPLLPSNPPRRWSRSSGLRSRPRRFASICIDWATPGSVPAMCPPNHRTPSRNASRGNAGRANKGARHGDLEIPGRHGAVRISTGCPAGGARRAGSM